MAEQGRVMVVRCPKCRRKVFRYLKVGKGRLIRCLKDRLREDLSVRQGQEVLCPCGGRIGRDEGAHIRVYGAYRLG